MSGRAKVYPTLYEAQQAAAEEKRDRALDALLAAQPHWSGERSERAQAQRRARLNLMRQEIPRAFAALSAVEPPTQEAVADRLQCSARTLNRFLHEWHDETGEQLTWPPSTWPDWTKADNA